MAGYVFNNWATFGDTHTELFKAQAREFYKRNLQILTGLAGAFHFKLLVFYQPNGNLDPHNLMRGDVPESAPGLHYLSEIQKTVRSAIRSEGWPMIDLTDSLSGLSQENRAYIDAEHYSPLANEVIAQVYGRYMAGAEVAISTSFPPLGKDE